MAIAIVAAAAISAASAYFGNQAAAKQAEKTRQDAIDWRNKLEKQAQPFMQGSQADYNLLADALGVHGQAGIQSYLKGSLNPLLAGAQSNALDAMNQKYAAMGYGPLSGNQIAAANNLMQQSYLNQYNTQVGQLEQAARGEGAIGANILGSATATLGASTQAGLAGAQYQGQAIAGAGQAFAKGISDYGSYWMGQGLGSNTGAAATPASRG